jgi:hypothetical protein
MEDSARVDALLLLWEVPIAARNRDCRFMSFTTLVTYMLLVCDRPAARSQEANDPTQ